MYWVQLYLLYRPENQTTHKNGDFSLISVIEGHCASTILKVEHHVADRFCATFCGSVQVFGL